MSVQTNTEIFERAYEALEYLENAPDHLDDTLFEAIKAKDLDEMRRITAIAEGLMSQEHFAELYGNEGLTFDEEGRIAEDVA